MTNRMTVRSASSCEPHHRSAGIRRALTALGIDLDAVAGYGLAVRFSPGCGQLCYCAVVARPSGTNTTSWVRSQRAAEDQVAQLVREDLDARSAA